MNPALPELHQQHADHSARRNRLWPSRPPMMAIRPPAKQWSAPTVTLVSDNDDARIRQALRAIGFRRVTSRLVAQEIAIAFGVSADDVIGYSKKPQFTKPRMIAMTLAFRLLTNSAQGTKRQIGLAFGRDHSTVWHAVNCYSAMVDAALGIRGR